MHARVARPNVGGNHRPGVLMSAVFTLQVAEESLRVIRAFFAAFYIMVNDITANNAVV